MYNNKKSITKIIFLAAILLLTCAKQKAMEEDKAKQQLPELELVTTQDIHGEDHICNPHQHKMNYFLIFKHETKTIEIRDKQCNKIDEITSKQIVNVIQKSRIIDQQKKNYLTEEEIIKYMLNDTSVSNFFGKKEIWVTIELFKYIIRYCPHEKRFTEIHFKDLPLIPYSTKDEPLPNCHTSNLSFSYNNYRVFSSTYFENEDDGWGQIKFKYDIVVHNNNKPTSIPKIIPLTSIDKNGTVETVFGGNHCILVCQSYFSKKNTNTFYSIETGKPIIINEQPLELKTIIPNWHETYCPCPNRVLFGEKSNFMVIIATNEDFKKQIILIDLTSLKPVAQYTFPRRTFDYRSKLTLHLSKDEQEIIVVADIDEKICVFKNPLAKPEEDIYKQERTKYVLNLESPRAKYEKDPILIHVNGRKMPIDRGLLLLG